MVRMSPLSCKKWRIDLKSPCWIGCLPRRWKQMNRINVSRLLNISCSTLPPDSNPLKVLCTNTTSKTQLKSRVCRLRWCRRWKLSGIRWNPFLRAKWVALKPFWQRKGDTSEGVATLASRPKRRRATSFGPVLFLWNFGCFSLSFLDFHAVLVKPKHRVRRWSLLTLLGPLGCVILVGYLGNQPFLLGYNRIFLRWARHISQMSRNPCCWLVSKPLVPIGFWFLVPFFHPGLSLGMLVFTLAWRLFRKCPLGPSVPVGPWMSMRRVGSKLWVPLSTTCGLLVVFCMGTQLANSMLTL